jgi:hypothetical protein
MPVIWRPRRLLAIMRILDPDQNRSARRLLDIPQLERKMQCWIARLSFRQRRAVLLHA